jgi:hypothetical protein
VCVLLFFLYFWKHRVLLRQRTLPEMQDYSISEMQDYSKMLSQEPDAHRKQGNHRDNIMSKMIQLPTEVYCDYLCSHIFSIWELIRLTLVCCRT